MSLMRGLDRHLSVAVLALTTLGTALPSAQTSVPDGPARFTVVLRGVRVGSEVVDVARTPNSIKISASGQLLAPFDLATSKFEMTYSADWQPQQLSIEGVLRGQVITLSTTFGLTTATSDMLQGTQRGSVTHTISPRAIVLPNNFFGAYEAVAARLSSLAVGGRLPLYVAPESEVAATVTSMTPRRITSPGGVADLTQYVLAVSGGTNPSVVHVWIDHRSRLARVELPAASLVVIRDDIASVMSREERVRNPSDEDVFIPASGFSLAATMTRPQSGSGRLPAVILVGGPGRQDRDETLYGVSIFGQIAGRLAEAGYFVVRYDKRGIGQSGGRTEHASVVDYAGDLLAAVNWLRKRKDIDEKRIGVVAHAEGAAVALTAAGKEKHIKAIALLAAPGRTGRELTLEQQQRLLTQLKESETSRQAKIALQTRLMDAVISGRGWETLPPDLRRQAETPWFRSWLLFDPAVALSKVNQPLLIMTGSLDSQIPPAHADRLEALALARKKVPAMNTRKVLVADVNHLLIPATTGSVDEYESLTTKTIAPQVTTTLVDWLKAVLVKNN